jgi:hypothetical protein
VLGNKVESDAKQRDNTKQIDSTANNQRRNKILKTKVVSKDTITTLNHNTL